MYICIYIRICVCLLIGENVRTSVFGKANHTATRVCKAKPTPQMRTPHMGLTTDQCCIFETNFMKIMFMPR